MSQISEEHERESDVSARISAQLASRADLLDAATRVMAVKKAWDDYAKIGMPARALLEPPDRATGNKAFADLAAAIARATGAS